jgi:phosphatidylglycerol---prolipoprotein diacylglyceryl transferase
MALLHALGLHSPPLAYFVLNIDPIAIQLGPLAIHWYGLAYVVAIVVGTLSLRRWCARMGIGEDQMYGLLIWTAIMGLIGGRLYFVIQQDDLVDHYLKQPQNIFAVWNGGMAFFGAIFLGTATLFAIAPRYGLSRWIAIDGGAVFALIGQIFGRLGNVVNGDILGAQASAGPVAIPGDTCSTAPCVAYVADPHIQPAWSFVYLNPHSFAQTGIAFQPAQVYEMLMNVALLVLLLPLASRLPRIRAGFFFIMYLAGYAVTQLVVFFFRATEKIIPLFGTDVFKQAQWTAIVVLLLCIPLYLYVRRVSAPWPYSAQSPVPWPPTVAEATPTGRTSAAPRSDAALQSVAVDLPPWKPARIVGGGLRNRFGPPSGGTHIH